MVLEIVAIASGINFLLLAIVLWLKRNTFQKSNAILVTLFLLMTLYCGSVAIHYTALANCYYAFLRYYTPLDGMFLLSMGPCLYFYTLSVLYPQRTHPVRQLVPHALPFIPYLLFCIYFLTLPYRERIEWLINDFTNGSVEMNWLNGLIYTQTIVYLSVSYRLVAKRLKTICEGEEKAHIRQHTWLKRYFLMTLCVVIVSLPICYFMGNERASIIIGQIVLDIQFIYMYFKWTLHNHHNVPPLEPPREPKSNNSKWNEEEADKMLEKLNKYMEQYKPYLNEKCNTTTLSQQTGIPVYQLTRLVNSLLCCSIPDYINQLRITEIRKQLLSIKPEINTIESIAYDCGYRSKSAFQRAFKKHSNNLTPSEYIRLNKKAE